VDSTPQQASDGLTTNESSTPNAEYTIVFGDSHDWLQLTTGEWLRGRLRWMHAKGLQAGEQVKFYSEQLNDLLFDWYDVAQVHCANVKTLRFQGHRDVVGKCIVTMDRVVVEAPEGPKTFPRSKLVAIIDGEARERNWWSTALSVGFSANAGNTNQGSLNSTWSLQRADGRTLARLDYNGNVSWANGSLNANRHLVGFDVNLLVWKKFYVIPAVGQVLYDKFQNLKLRATPGAGGGMHAFSKAKRKKNHTNRFQWDLQAALGYQFARFFSTASGVANPQSDGFIMFRTFWKFDLLSGDVEISLDWRTNLVYTQIGNTNHVGTAVITIEVTDMIDFAPSFLFLRTENPEPEADGTVPKKNDYQVVVSLALEFG